MALVFIYGKLGEISSDEFDTLYDKEVSDSAKGARYKPLSAATDANSPDFLVLHDTPEVPSASSDGSHPPQSIASRFSSLDKRVYTLISSLGTKPSEGAPTLLIVETEIKDDDNARDEFYRWYEEEHIPLLSKVPGFIRARRYKIEMYQGEKPSTYLAVYEIESPAYVQEPSFKEATSTKWMGDVGNKWVTKKTKAVWNLAKYYGA